MPETINLEIRDHIAHLTLNRPDKMNAVSEDLITDLLAATTEIVTSDARVVLLSGAGKAFCAGLDVSNFQRFITEDLDTLVMDRTHGDANLFQAFTLALYDLPIPVIAALHGPVFGAGMQLAAAADMRIASPDAKLSIMEMKWGLIPDMGGMVTLPQILRADVLKRLTYSHEILSAPDALAVGLVTEVSDDAPQRALELCQNIAAKSPSAVRAAKALIDEAYTLESRADVLMAESARQRDLIGKSHQMESVMAQMQKRAPVYK